MQREGGDASGDRTVAAFLRANPGWLAANPELYAVLEPPRRRHGEAVADHMAAMLDQARRQGTDTAAGRRAAEGFTGRVHEAVLTLMRAADPVWCVQHEVAVLLRIESARLCAEAAVPGVAGLPSGTVAARLEGRCAVVRDAGRDPLLHGEVAPLVRREALLLVPLAAGPALLALASREEDGFEGAGTSALAFLGHAVAAAIERA